MSTHVSEPCCITEFWNTWLIANVLNKYHLYSMEKTKITPTVYMKVKLDRKHTQNRNEVFDHVKLTHTALLIWNTITVEGQRIDYKNSNCTYFSISQHRAIKSCYNDDEEEKLKRKNCVFLCLYIIVGMGESFNERFSTYFTHFFLLLLPF